MQTKQTTGLPTAANDYVTIVQQACNKVTGFLQLYKEMERSITITGKSRSTLTNYSRQLAHLALHYNCFPLDLDAEQGNGKTHCCPEFATQDFLYSIVVYKSVVTDLQQQYFYLK